MLLARRAQASRSRRTRRPLILAVALLTTLAIATGAYAVATAPSLGTASGFAVLAGSTVTNTGPTVVTGDLGAGTAVTGFPSGIVIGTIRAGDAVAAQADVDATIAFNNLAGQACDTILTGTDLGGLTLTPGVSCFASSAQLTGTLTLDGQGDPNAVFVFQIGSTLTTASGSSVLLLNGANPCNVFFQVGSSATLGTGTVFAGNILAQASITLNSGARLSGRALALTGAVTLDSNNVSGCSSVLSVTVRSFTASASGSSTTLRWRTASEAGLLGYNVYRQVNGKRTRVNRSLIAAKERGLYSFLDRRAAKGKVVRYWIQVVNLDGSRTWYGPARVTKRA